MTGIHDGTRVVKFDKAQYFERTHPCMHTHTHTPTHVRTHTHTHTHTQIHTHTHTHARTHTYQHTLQHTHTHTHKVKQNFIAPLGRRPRGSTGDYRYQVCVIMVTMRGWADVGLWVAVCFLAKISLHRPKTTFARLTVTGNLAVNSVFITFRLGHCVFFLCFSLHSLIDFSKL